MNTLKRSLLISLIVIFITACGGGAAGAGAGAGAGGNSTSSVLTGRFIDAPVEGLKYSTATESGFTNSLGEFSYKEGEAISFSIGNLELGSAIGGEFITPLSLTGESDLNNISSKATNIARLLQTLDETPTNEGKITLPVILRQLDLSNITGVDFSAFASDSDLNIILNAATNLTSTAYVLMDASLAKDAMKYYINLISNYNLMSAGTYSGQDNVWYILTMPSDGVIDFSTTYARGSVFDTNLNPVTLSSGYSIFDTNAGYNGRTNLNAGSYLIKINYRSSSSSVTVNSPLLN